jgi:hypothetical protein
MSEMILSMNANFSRLLPVVDTPPPLAQAVPFSTPQTLPPHSLSPIPEITTPASESGSAPMPPSFGKLTPDRLPHPNFPPPNSVPPLHTTHIHWVSLCSDNQTTIPTTN